MKLQLVSLLKQILLFISCIVVTSVFGQSGGTPLDNLPKVVPASPNAANLGMYNHTDISYYTGTPNISIPLVEVSTGNLNLPLSVSYHANGIKVEEISSWVGLGWNLNAGGVITRSINGYGDLEEQNGTNYISHAVKLRDVLNNKNLPQNKAILAKIAAKQYDGEPDIFNISCPGLSGKFFYNQDKAGFICSPNQNIRIVYDAQEKTFVLTNTSGVEYSFEAYETNEQVSITGAPLPVITAWYLTKIRDLKSQEEVLLGYEPTNYIFSSLGVETKGEQFEYFGNDPQRLLPDHITQRTAPINSNTVQSLRLKEILFKNGRISFNKSTSSRSDLLNDYSLSSIDIYDNYNRIKRIDFYQSYFISGDIPYGGDPYAKFRLKLDSLKIWDGNNINNFQPYKFNYYGDGAIINRLSRSQDYWGYYNNSNGQTLLPAIQYGYWRMPGNDKRAYPSLSGTISEIHYPTGGYTNFEFEGNQIAAPHDPAEPHSQDYVVGLEAGVDWTSSYNNGQSEAIVKKSYFERQFGYDSSQAITVNGTVPALYFYIRKLNPSDIENFKWNVDPYGYYPFEPESPGIQFYDVNTPSVNLLNSAVPDNTQGEGWYRVNNVPAGTYMMSVDYTGLLSSTYTRAAYCELYSIFNVGVRIPYLNTSSGNTVWENKFVGGLRIKKMYDYASLNSEPLITSFSYNANGEQGLSTGKIQFEPNFYYKAAYIDPALGGDLATGTINYFTYLKRFSMPTMPMAYTQGSHIGYQRVTVNKISPSANETLRSEYLFTTFNNYPDDIHNAYPYCRGTSYDWKRGLLESEFHFKKENNTYKLVKEKGYEYKTVLPGNPLLSKSIGVGAGFMFGDEYVLDVRPDPVLASDYPIIEDSYEVISEDFSVSKETETSFDDNQQLESIREYFYDSPALLVPTRVRTRRSNSDSIDLVLKYPKAYQPTGIDNGGIFNLVEKNIFTPVEEYQVNLNKNAVTQGRITLYNEASNPSEIYSLQSATLISRSSFSESNLAGNTVQMDANYRKKFVFNLYDIHGNVLEQEKLHDIKEVYLWGYNAQYPVARIVGSDYMTVMSKIAGLQSQIDAATNISGNDANVRLLLDGLRTAFASEKTVQVSTYTYKPLVGIASETDPAGRTIYYEYDTFNRLKLQKDEQGNILKTYCYNYAGQTVNCNQ